MLNASNTSLKRIASSVGNSVTSIKSFVSRNKIQPVDLDSSSAIYDIKDFDNYIPQQPKPRTDKSLASLTTEETDDNHECGKKFLSVVRRAWATRYTEEVSSNKVHYLKTALRELVIYIIFLTFLLFVAYGTRSDNLFYLTTAITNVMTLNSYQSVSSMDTFWAYITGDFVNALYWQTWYNSKTDVQPNEREFIYFENKLIGVPQIRQLRIRSDTCKITSYFRKIFNNCYGDYSSGNINKTNFGPLNETAWTYQPPSPGGDTISGYFANYDSGGFIQNLTRDATTTTAILNNLQNNLWTDHGTRVVFIDFTVYNANVNLYCIVKLIFEFPTMGGVVKSTWINTIKLLRYESMFDYFLLFCEILVIVFIVYYTIEEIIEIQRNRLAYFKKVWNVLDVFMVIMSLVSILINVYRVIQSRAAANSLVNNQNAYVNFDFYVNWNKYFDDAMTINSFFGILKIFKYISFNKTMNQLTDTLANSVSDLAGFAVMFLIVFFAFAEWGTLQFGSQLQDFYQFQDSVFTLFRLVLGDFNFVAMIKVNNFVGPIFFISYVFFVFFVLMNMFIAIINESYEAVKDSLSKSKDEFKITQFLKMQFFNKFKRNRVVKIQEVLEQASITNSDQLSFQTWRDELQGRGYADVEIQALFMRYDADGDRTLDYEERRKMLNDIKRGKLSVEENQSDSEDSKSTMMKEIENDLVDEELFTGLVEKVDVVEKSIHEIVNKIDEVLARLNTIEKAKLEQQKSVSCSLSILTGFQNSVNY